jgi:arginine exporter protein ArgO
MDRLLQTLVFLLIIVGIGNAFVVWEADRHARDAAKDAQTAAEHESCLQKQEATAVIGLLAPEASIDKKGRLQAMSTLGDLVDAC